MKEHESYTPAALTKSAPWGFSNDGWSWVRHGALDKWLIVKDSDSPAAGCLTRLMNGFNQGIPVDESDIILLENLVPQSE